MFLFSEVIKERIIKGRFRNVPLEDDAKIIFEKISKLNDYEVLYQIWSWDGIKAQSIIFTEADAEKLSDDEIEKLIRALDFIDNETELKINRSVKGYTFVNFTADNFDNENEEK